TVSAFGYAEQTQTAAVPEGETVSLDFVLAAASEFTVSGTVTNAETGEPVEGATVGLGSPIEPVTTDADGAFSFAAVPAGTYTLTATAGACADPYSESLTVDGDETVDVALEPVFDDYGYYCTVGTA